MSTAPPPESTDPRREAALQALGLDTLSPPDQVDALLARLDLASSQAAHDPVTGLWQQGAILGQLEQAHARALRDHRPLGVMKLRARYFGDHQDPLLDPVGAQVLRAVAQRLRDTLRGGDTIGRVAGNHFLCLLEGCGIDAASLVAERCRKAVGSLPVMVQHDGASLTLVSAAVALVMVHPNAEVPTEGILEQADSLLEQALRQSEASAGVLVLAPA